MRRLLTLIIGVGIGFLVLAGAVMLVGRGVDQRAGLDDEARRAPATMIEVPQALIEDLLQLSARRPVPPGRPVAVTELTRSAHTSLHAVRLRTAIAAHYHREQDETVCVVAGRATMTLGEEVVQAGPGTVLFIPRGTVHAVTNDDTTTTVIALSCFTPPDSGRDRHLVDAAPGAAK